MKKNRSALTIPLTGILAGQLFAQSKKDDWESLQLPDINREKTHFSFMLNK